jgi:hypothetical protein
LGTDVPTDQDPNAAALQRLDLLTGEWEVEAFGNSGPVVCEWILDGQFLIQRSQAPDPVPDSTAIIGVAEDGESYVQHYFDSRGIARTNAMTLAGGVWTLLRDKPDFTPLSFYQRFEGKFSEDGKTIDARWEKSEDGSNWELDFPLTYKRL